MAYRDLLDEGRNFDLIDKYLNMAMTFTAQKEFYTSTSEQVTSFKETCSDMILSERMFLSHSLLMPINDVVKQYIIAILLKSSKDVPKETKHLENRIILTALKNMQPNRAIKTFSLIKDMRINNARTKWLAVQFLNSLNQELHPVKYRKHLKKLIEHAHIKPEADDEVFDFLFNKKTSFNTPLFNDYIKAKTDPEYVYKLPYSVALGFKSLHKIPDEEFMKRFKKFTKAEKLDIQEKAKKAGTRVAIDLTKYAPTEMLKYFRSYPDNSSQAAFDDSTKKIASSLPFSFDDACILLDNSQSMYGSEQKKFHPISVAESVAYVLINLTKDPKHANIITTNEPYKFMCGVGGASNLSKGLLKALKNKPELLVIISDGYENAPFSGLASQVIESYMKKIDKSSKTTIIHLNPVYAPEADGVKKLSNLVDTFGIRDERQLYLILMSLILKRRKEKELTKLMKELRKDIISIS